MKIEYKGKKYKSKYNPKTNTVGVVNPNLDILEALDNDRIQRGLLMSLLLCNTCFNLDEALKNPRL